MLALQYTEVILKKDALTSPIARHEVRREEDLHLIVDVPPLIPLDFRGLR